jgi:hypothetical protein
MLCNTSNGRTDQEKRAAKARAAEEKLATKQAKEAEKIKTSRAHRKSKDIPATEAAGVDTEAPSNNEDLYQEPTSPETQRLAAHDSADPTSPMSQGSPKGFKSLLNKLKRRSKNAPVTETEGDTKEKEPGFIGGATLRNSISHPQSQSQSSKSASQPARESIDSHLSGEVDRPKDLGHVEPVYVPHVGVVQEDRYSDVSSLSSDGDEFSMARGRSAERVVSGATATSGGESFEEARDHFDAALAPPPAFGSDVETARKGSPNRESKFQEVGL